MSPGPDEVAAQRPAALVVGLEGDLAHAVVAALAAAGCAATMRAPTGPASDTEAGAARAIAYLSASVPRSGLAAAPAPEGPMPASPSRDEIADVAAWAAWLAARGGGQLVVVAPVRGLLGSGDEREAEAAALAGAVRHAAVRWGSAGVAANLVAAGAPLATGDADTTKRRGAAPARGAALRGRPVHVDEVASVVAFLCGRSAAFVNGAIVPVDGGASMGFF